MNPQPDDDAPNEFSALDSLDLLAAFLHAKYGRTPYGKPSPWSMTSTMNSLWKPPMSSTLRASPTSPTSWQTWPQAAPQNTTPAAPIATP